MKKMQAKDNTTRLSVSYQLYRNVFGLILLLNAQQKNTFSNYFKLEIQDRKRYTNNKSDHFATG